MALEVSDQIKNLQEKETITNLTEHNLSVNPEGCEKSAKEYKKESKKNSLGIGALEYSTTPENAAKAIAIHQFVYLKTISGLLAKIMSVIEQGKAGADIGVALSGVLICFVKPKDILPDDIPGGIGFPDDGIVIYSIADEFLPILNPEHIKPENIKMARYVFSFGIPEDLIPTVKTQVDQIWKSFHLLKATPPSMIEMILQQLVTNPYALQAIFSQDVYQNACVPPMTPGMTFFPFPAGTTFSSTPGGGSILTEPGGTSISFAGGGGAAAMVGNDIVCWD